MVVFGVVAYVRLAPVTPMRVTQSYRADTDIAGGYVAVRTFEGDAAEVLARVSQVALATPRTVQISDRPLTFVTRSRVMGFPDVTQVIVQGNRLTVHAHLVYGASDMGVNKARVLAWLEQLGPL